MPYRTIAGEHMSSHAMGIVTYLAASITTIITYFQSIQWGAVSTGVLAAGGIIGTIWAGIKEQQRKDAQKAWEMDQQHKRDTAKMEAEAIIARAEAEAKADAALATTRAREIADLKAALAEVRQDLADRDIQWKDWRERYHVHKNEAQVVLSRAQLEAAEAKKEAERLKVELEATKVKATVIKEKVVENTIAIKDVIDQTHVAVTPPDPLADSDEHDTMKPPA